LKNQLLISTAEPFFFRGDSVGCLLVHGFTGTPKEMRPLGENLAHNGHTVLGVRLAGHSTALEDMVRMHWEDWLASVEDGIHLLKTCTDQIFIIGLSMGGVLALLSAARYPVHGAIALSTPCDLPHNSTLRFLSLISLVKPGIEKGPSDWRDPQNLIDHVSYRQYPTRSIRELADLISVMRASLPEVKIPVLLMQSRVDTSIPQESMEWIYAHLGTQDKEKIWLENSGHVITREPEKELVFAEAEKFIYRLKQLQ
jgi:carboxylesterase